jgi:hypothetical protein
MKFRAAVMLRPCSVLLVNWESESHWPLLSPERSKQVKTKKGKKISSSNKTKNLHVVFRMEYIHNKYHNTWVKFVCLKRLALVYITKWLWDAAKSPPPNPHTNSAEASRPIHQIVAVFGLKNSTGPRLFLQRALSKLDRIYNSIPRNILMINVYTNL